MTLRRTVAVVAAAVVVLAVGSARSCRSHEKAHVDDGQRAARASASPFAKTGERHSELVVAEGLRPQVMEFADAYTGYVLLSGCSQECGSALFVTFDGGLSWVERTLPFGRIEAVNLWLVDADTVIVAGRPLGWFRSTDAGRTFERGGDGEPAPAEYLRGPSVGCVDPSPACPRILLMNGRAALEQPFVGGLRDAEQAPDGTLFAVSAAGTAVTTATSRDGGRTWATVGGPLTVPVADAVSLSVSPDGKDVWLVASNAESLSAYLWGAGGWREVKRGLPVPTRMGGMVALGGGVLAVACSRFSYLHADGRFHHADRPMNAVSVHLLGDGTLITSTAPSDVWLGAGDAVSRVWNRVTVDPQWR